MAEQEFTTEEWQPVNSYETRYSVSDCGRIRSEYDPRSVKRGAVILASRPNIKGYLYVRLSKGHRNSRYHLYIHTAVARAFLGERPTGYEINHKDGNKSNNHVGNLEYVTGSQNMKHAVALGLVRVPVQKGESHWNFKSRV